MCFVIIDGIFFINSLTSQSITKLNVLVLRISTSFVVSCHRKENYFFVKTHNSRTGGNRFGPTLLDKHRVSFTTTSPSEFLRLPWDQCNVLWWTWLINCMDHWLNNYNKTNQNKTVWIFHVMYNIIALHILWTGLDQEFQLCLADASTSLKECNEQHSGVTEDADEKSHRQRNEIHCR